jgi:hypothetical protein
MKPMSDGSVARRIESLCDGYKRGEVRISTIAQMIEVYSGALEGLSAPDQQRLRDIGHRLSIESDYAVESYEQDARVRVELSDLRTILAGIV